MESISSLIERAVEMKRAEYEARGEVVTIGRCHECGTYSVWGGIVHGRRSHICRHCKKQATIQFYPPKVV